MAVVLAEEEWGGIFELDSTVAYTWSAQKVDGAYAEETLKLFVYPVAGANETELDAAFEAYEAQVNSTGFIPVTTATGNSTLLLETPLQLQFEATAWMSLFDVAVPQSGFYAVIAEHDPEEFVSTDHYLKDADGNDIEPLYVHAHDHDEEEHEEEDEEQTRWGQTMGACVAVWVVTFVGIVFITLSVAGLPMSPKLDFFGKLFAAGGLLGTAFCLIFLEASHYIETKGSLSEGEMHGHWAAMVLTGFITPVLIDFLSKGLLTAAMAPSVSSSSVKETAIVAVAGTATATTAATATVQGSYELVEGVKSDSNGNDGGDLGTEKLQAPQSTIIQELSDFLVLTKAAQLPAWQALLWNAASGLSVILGGIVIASAQVNDYTVGMLLAFGAGQYLYIGAVELMPMIHDTHHTATVDPLQHVSVGTDEEAAAAADEQETATAAPAAAMKVTPFDRAVGLVFFMVAVVVAGLILLNHEHCEVGSHSDSSGDGHNH
eukprot:gene8523-6148_t